MRGEVKKVGLRLALERVSLTYQAGTPFAAPALRDISLTVEPGERLGIAGPVGSGKSTLLAVLAGVEEPGSGRVLHDGSPVTPKKPSPPGSVGLAFQSPENCLFARTVADDVAFSPKHQGLSGEGLAGRVNAAMSAAGLDPGQFGPRSPFTLSAGEQRRAALAGVMAAAPRALLLDEPTAYLDPASRRGLIERLVALNRDTGATMVVIGHDMQELAAFATRLVIVDGGSVVAAGATRRVLSDAELLEAHGLEPPGTVVLSQLLADASGAAVPAALSETEAVSLLRNLIED